MPQPAQPRRSPFPSSPRSSRTTGMGRRPAPPCTLLNRLRGCAVGLALSLLGAAPAWAQVMETFEGLRCTDQGSNIPSGAGGLNWSNFLCLNGVASSNNPSGYQAGATSGTNVALNGGALPASLTRPGGGAFSLGSGQFTAAWRDGLTITVKGYRGSAEVANLDIHPKADKPTPVDLSRFANVDRVVLS